MAKKPWGSTKRPTDSNGRPLLLRSEAGQRLGVSTAMVRKLEQTGVLEGIELGGVHYFTRDAVTKAAERRTNTLAGRAFQLFGEGVTPTDAVVQLNADPGHVQRLWEAFHKLEGSYVVQGPKSLRAWEASYGLELGSLTPGKLLRALEIVCCDPRLRAELEHA